jgi:hypothetical protein
MPTPPYTKLDAAQVLKLAYDEAERRIRVDSTLSLDGGDLNITLDHTEDSVRIGNGVSEDYLTINSDGSINATLVPNDNPLFDEGSSVINSTTWVSIYSYTSTDDNTRIINLECNCSTTAKFRVKIDGSIKRLRRGSPLQRTVDFEFKQPRPLLNGEIIEVECQVEDLDKNNADTFVALEGFII